MNIHLPYLFCTVVLVAQNSKFERFEGFWACCLSGCLCISSYMTRVENSNSSSAEAIFAQNIPSLGFQDKQQKRGKIHGCARTIQSKIRANGLELALEQKRLQQILKRSECVATNPCKMVTTGFEKAFYSLSWNFLFKILEKLRGRKRKRKNSRFYCHAINRNRSMNEVKELTCHR